MASKTRELRTHVYMSGQCKCEPASVSDHLMQGIVKFLGRCISCALCAGESTYNYVDVQVNLHIIM